MMRLFCLMFLSFSVVVTGCTDLSKVEKEGSKDPLETEKPPIEVAEAMGKPGEPQKEESVIVAEPSQKMLSYPFKRLIKDINGREIDVQILAKRDSNIAFQRKGNSQKFILSLDRLSEPDQAYFRGLDDGGNFQSIESAISRDTELAGRVASWNRELESAENEAAELGLPRLTAFLFSRDPRSESIGRKFLFNLKFRTWAGRNLVLCYIKVEPSKTKLAITSEMAKNQKMASSYGVIRQPAILINIPGDEGNIAVPLGDVETMDDFLREIQTILDNPGSGKHYIEEEAD